MITSELKKSIYRTMSDLIKFDNTISIDELDLIDRTAQVFSITKDDILDSYSTTLEEACDCIAKQKTHTKEKLISLLDECALKDGECSRNEAILISAIEIVCSNKGRIISLPLNNRPILSSQILYVDPTFNPRKNELDKNFYEIKNIVELAGFELIYIPMVAKSFKESKSHDALRRFLQLVNPTLNEGSLVNKIMSLREMDSRYFYLKVLNGKLQMNLNIDKPCWLVRLQNNVVNGIGYANYLCYNVETEAVSRQLKDYINSINRRLHPYTITVNQHFNISQDFLYDGFYKALVDTLVTETVENWEIKVYVRAGSSFIVDKSSKGEKFSISITRGSMSYPIKINGREAAFYLLLLCGSASSEQCINFDYHKNRSIILQNQYSDIYHIFSNRDGHTPDITSTSTSRPIKAKVMKALKESGIKGALHLFKPTKKGSNSYYIPLPSENVKIVNHDGEISLKDSAIYKRFIGYLNYIQ